MLLEVRHMMHMRSVHMYDHAVACMCSAWLLGQVCGVHHGAHKSAYHSTPLASCCVDASQMSLGEKSILHITSDYAYGPDGAGGVIPPNADLDFEVQLLEIN